MEIWTGWFYSGFPRVGQHIRVECSHKHFTSITRVFEGTVVKCDYSCEAKLVSLDTDEGYEDKYDAIRWKYRLNAKKKELENANAEET